MIELIGEMIFGLAVMFAVFGTVGISLGVGSLAAAVAGMAIDGWLARRARR